MPSSLSPSSAARGHLSSARSLSPRGQSRPAVGSSGSGPVAGRAVSGLYPRRPPVMDVGDGRGSVSEGPGNPGAGASSSAASQVSPDPAASDSVTAAEADTAKRRFFFGSTGEVIRAIAVSASNAGSTAVSPSPAPPPPPPSRTPLQGGHALSPASVLPKEPAEPEASRTASLTSSRDGLTGSAADWQEESGGSPGTKASTPSGGRRSWVETPSSGKGDLPSLFAPVELHARDGDGLGHQVLSTGEDGLLGQRQWIGNVGWTSRG